MASTPGALGQRAQSPPSTPSLELFLDAQETYFQNISAEAKDALFPKSPFQSSKDLIEELKKTGVFLRSNHLRRLGGSLDKVKNFADKLEPYFETIGIFVQSHPEVAGIVWGTIRAALLFACNHASFFENLAKTIDALSSALPQLEQVKKIFDHYGRAPSPKFKFALQQSYLDLFFFFERLGRIFRQKNGKSRWTLKVLVKLSTTSFEDRFNDILLRMKQQHNFIRNEVQIVLLENSMAQLSTQEEALKLEQQISLDLAEILTTQDESFERSRAMLETELEKYNEGSEKALRHLREQATAYIEKLEERVGTARQETTTERVRRLKLWVDAPDFETVYVENRDVREEGTAQWLFEEDAFKAWKFSKPKEFSQGDHFRGNALFISGDPGNGKSVLAAASVEELLNLPSSHCYYFFFSANGPKSGSNPNTKRANGYRSVLTQAIHHLRDDITLMDTLEIYMSNSAVGQKPSTLDLIDLLSICVSSQPNTFVLFDGIDECKDTKEFLADLTRIFGGSEVKVLLFGRPNLVTLADSLVSDRHFNIGKRTECDIRNYATRQLRSLIQSRLLPADADLKQLVGRLVFGSDGMFLWAKLMIGYLNLSVLQPRKRVKLLMDVATPERLDNVYERIISHINRLDTAEQHLASWVIAWLSHALTDLTTEQLRESSRLVYTETEEEANDAHQFERSVVVSCACLVKKDLSKKPAVFRFMHTSAKEFILRNRSYSPHSITLSSAASHVLIARGCIQYLLSVIQPHSDPHQGQYCRTSLLEKYPLSAYASINWTYHLEEAASCMILDVDKPKTIQHQRFQDLVTIMTQFLSKPTQISVWLEAVYVFGASTSLEFRTKSEIERRIEQHARTVIRCANLSRRAFAGLPGAHQEDIWEQWLQLGEFWQRLNEKWGEQLMRDPSCIWLECAAFEPDSWIANTEKMQVFPLESNDHEFSTALELSTADLTTISVTSTSGVHVAILGIWPSRVYQDVAMQTDQRLAWTENTRKSLKQLSRGWVARYQIFSLADEPEVVFEIHVILEQSKIWTQIRQSLWKDGKGNVAETCRLQFPVSISGSLRRFSVLGDVYTPQSSKDSTLSYHISSVVPNFSESLREHWSWSSLQHTQTTNTGYPEDITLDSWIHRNCMLYIYWIWLSPDGSYAFFIDKPPSKASNLAVYDLGQLEPVSIPRIVSRGSLTLYQGIQGVYCDAVAFHPTRHLLVFTFVGSVYLWPFDHDVSSIEKIYYGLDSYETVNFSNDGELVIIKAVGSGYCCTKGIPQTIQTLLRVPKLIESKPESPNNTEHISSSDQVSALWNVQVSNIGASDAVHGAQLIRHKDGSVSEISTTAHSDHDINISIRDNGRYEAMLEFSKLPKGMDTKHMSTTLLPHLRQGRLRMVLEGARRPWSNLSKIKRTRPMVIEKDRRSTKYYHREVSFDWSKFIQPTLEYTEDAEDNKGKRIL